MLLRGDRRDSLQRMYATETGGFALVPETAINRSYKLHHAHSRDYYMILKLDQNNHPLERVALIFKHLPLTFVKIKIRV